jgi:prepilin-type N-terminal cleavage/methylation domain-containing protein
MNKKSAGFSLTELVIVIAVGLVLTAMAIPQFLAMLQAGRMTSDARSIASQLSLARMRAASLGEPARVNFNLAANTYTMELCTSLCNTANATYIAEGGTQYLSQGVSYGAGGVATPAGGQTTLAQTSLITFNTRGLSVDGTGNPTGTSAIYINNGQGFEFAVTVSIGGQPTAWKYNGTVWKAL